MQLPYGCRLSQAEDLIVCLILSQFIFMSPLSLKFSKAAHFVSDMNRILLPKLQLSLFPKIKSLHIKLLCCLFTYCQCSPNFCYHQIMINITTSSPERLYIVCTRMPSLIYHYMISLTGYFSKSGTRAPPREYYAWWSQELLSVYRLGGNMDNCGRAFSGLFSRSLYLL